MRSFTLLRISSHTEVTQGVLIDNTTGLPFCVTLEEPWKNNAQNISCIPEGNYLCTPQENSKGQDVFSVHDVSGRSFIQIHAGNTVKDIEGCILLGAFYTELEGLPAIASSKKTMQRFIDEVKNESFNLTITRWK